MNPWAAFVLGLLIGWLIEWIIDWIYWRRRGQTAQISEEEQNRIERLEREIAGLRQENKRLEDVLSLRESELAAYSPSVAQRSLHVSTVPAVQQDDLLQIFGIDQRINDRLHNAGIYSYADLGALRPVQLREILGDSVEGDKGVEIIKEARLRSGSLKHVDDLIEINGIGPVIAEILYSAGIFSFADVANLTPNELREIVGERIERLANEEKILAHARQLANRA
jgi:predicted flap endonuclease-1-like 5' DNA nuclease